MKNALTTHCFTLFMSSSREKFCELRQQSLRKHRRVRFRYSILSLFLSKTPNWNHTDDEYD
ncbi:hypothetical protein HMPREF0880_04740 [Yokenella regensburgei ATCC 43003]|nr:hypothetical protein HMPREF0880_04740 [Yokenella regensburgei ATCC 43003]